MTVSGICLSSLRAMPRRPSRRNSLYWDHKTVYCLRISFDSQNLVITWPQHCERWTRSRINGWLSEVNRAKGFSIKAKRVKGFLGKHWTKKGSGGVGEEKVWLTLKNEGLRGLLIITGGVGVWTSPTSWAFIVGLTGDSRTYAFLPSLQHGLPPRPSSLTQSSDGFKPLPRGRCPVGLYRPHPRLSPPPRQYRGCITSSDPSGSRSSNTSLIIQLEAYFMKIWAPDHHRGGPLP